MTNKCVVVRCSNFVELLRSLNATYTKVPQLKYIRHVIGQGHEATMFSQEMCLTYLLITSEQKNTQTSHLIKVRCKIANTATY